MRAAVVFLLAALCAGCDSDPFEGGTDVSLLRSSWRVSGAANESGARLPIAAGFDAEFNASGNVEGHAGPNSYFGRYQTDGGRIQIDNIFNTEIGGWLADEGFVLLDIVRRADRFEVTASELRLDGPGSSYVLFQRVIP